MKMGAPVLNPLPRNRSVFVQLLRLNSHAVCGVLPVVCGCTGRLDVERLVVKRLEWGVWIWALFIHQPTHWLGFTWTPSTASCSAPVIAGALAGWF